MRTNETMATNQIRNQWIDRYVAEVGRMLPTAKRADVEMEMRSLIEEEIEDRSGPGDADEEIMLDVLRSFGPPVKMAARYGAQQYLIGPALYPTFITVLRIVLAVLVGLNLFGLVIDIGVHQARPGVLEAVAGLFNSLIAGGGMIVLIFALVERANRAELDKAATAGDWDPRSLPQVVDAERVSFGETVIGIAFTVAALVILNVYLDQLGFYYLPEEGFQPFPLFAPEFRQYVPWLTLWLGLDLVLNVILLMRGRWLAWLRGADLALQLFGSGILVWMLTGPTLAALPALDPLFRVGVGVVLLFTLFEAAKDVRALFLQWGRRSHSPSGLPASQ